MGENRQQVLKRHHNSPVRHFQINQTDAQCQSTMGEVLCQSSRIGDTVFLVYHSCKDNPNFWDFRFFTHNLGSHASTTHLACLRVLQHCSHMFHSVAGALTATVVLADMHCVGCSSPKCG